MKKLYSLLFFAALAAYILSGCQSNPNTSNKTNQVDTMNYLNVTVLLDLSNRIDSGDHSDQIMRDTLLLRSALNSFSEQVKKNGYIYSKDKIQVLIAPQAGNKPINFNPYIDAEELSKSGKVVRIILPDFEQQFIEEVKDIYANKQIFNGADIYTFFKDFPVENFIKASYKEEIDEGSIYYKFHNKMIILTDGYLAFEPKIQKVRNLDNSCMQMSVLRNIANWEKEISKYDLKPIVGKNYENLEVLLLEVNPLHPETNVNEAEIIEAYWKNWFTAMGVSYKPMHQSSEGIPLIKNSLKTFLEINQRL